MARNHFATYQVDSSHQIENSVYMTLAYEKFNAQNCPWPAEMSKDHPVFTPDQVSLDFYFHHLATFFQHDPNYNPHSHRYTFQHADGAAETLNLKRWFYTCATYRQWQNFQDADRNVFQTHPLTAKTDYRTYFNQVFSDLLFLELKIVLFVRTDPLNPQNPNRVLVWNGYNGHKDLVEKLLQTYHFPARRVDLINHCHTGRDATIRNTYGGIWDQASRLQNTLLIPNPTATPPEAIYQMMFTDRPGWDRNPFIRRTRNHQRKIATYYRQMYPTLADAVFYLNEPSLFGKLRNRIWASDRADWWRLYRTYTPWAGEWNGAHVYPTRPKPKPENLFRAIRDRTVNRLIAKFDRMNRFFPRDDTRFAQIHTLVTPADIIGAYQTFWEKVRVGHSKTIRTLDNAFFLETLRTLKELEHTLFVPDIFLYSLMSGDEVAAHYGFVPRPGRSFQPFPCVVSYLGYNAHNVFRSSYSPFFPVDLHQVSEGAWQDRGAVLNDLPHNTDAARIHPGNLTRMLNPIAPTGNIRPYCFDTGHGNLTLVYNLATGEFVVQDCGCVDSRGQRMRRKLHDLIRNVGRNTPVIDWTRCRAIFISHHHQDHVNLLPDILNRLREGGVPHPERLVIDATTNPFPQGWGNAAVQVLSYHPIIHDVPSYAYGYQFGGKTIFFQADGIINDLNILFPHGTPYDIYFLDGSFDLTHILKTLEHGPDRIGRDVAGAEVQGLLNHASIQDVVRAIDGIYAHGGGKSYIYIGGISGVAGFHPQWGIDVLINYLFALKRKYRLDGCRLRVLKSGRNHPTIPYILRWYEPNGFEKPPVCGGIRKHERFFL